MPFISTTTNASVSKETETRLKARLGQAIALIPGKSESWLMLSFHPDTAMYFRGNGDEKLAYVCVSLFGKATNKDYDKLTSEITDIISSELSINPDGIYVKYEEVDHWGWNGGNF